MAGKRHVLFPKLFWKLHILEGLIGHLAGEIVISDQDASENKNRSIDIPIGFRHNSHQ